MDLKLQDKLFKKYPSLFRDRHKSIQESCMPWGIDCGNGWYKILDELCYELSNLDVDVVFDQVKEKFGTLRIYYHMNFDFGINVYYEKIDKIVYEAEKMSAETCEVCGSKGKLRTDGWFRVLCDTCEETKNDGY
jgi:hypothetical protein